MALRADKRNYKKLSQLTQTPMINGILEAITAVVCCYATALNVD